MEKETIETIVPAIVPEETIPVVDDSEAKITALEAEKARLIEESLNYKLAYLKEKKKENFADDEENDDDKIRRITTETLANSRLAEIAREQDVIIKKALKENKELKLAQLNKITTPPTSTGSHNESIPVRDTIITPEQMSALKSRGMNDKDIERYKKNLLRYSGR